MKPKRKHAFPLFSLVVTCMMTTQSLHAASIYWDTNGTTAGSGNAGGTWDTATTTSWNTLADGTAAAVGFADGDTAIFSAGNDGTGAWTVTVSGTVQPSGITFKENGNKTISSGSISTASNPVISAAGRSNSNSYTISSLITGTGNLSLAANGDTSNTGGGVGGALTLDNGSNDFIGSITISSGVVSFVNDGAFGNSANTITISGGGLVSQGTRVLNHNVVLAGGGDRVFRCYGGTNSFTVNGSISGFGNVKHTDGGTLALTGGTSFSGHLYNYAGTLALSGTNTFAGNIFIQSNTTLRLDSDNTLPDSGDVLFWGGATFNVNGKTETLGALTVGSASDTNVTVNLGPVGSTGTLTVTDTVYDLGITNAGGSFYAKITGVGNIQYANTISPQDSWDLLNPANDFTGNITITSGRVRTDLNAGAGSFGNAANDLIFNGDVVGTLGNGEGTASLQGAASGALNLAATRDVILNSGKEGTLYVWGGNTYTINGKITGSGNLRKEDSGTLLVMNPSNDFTGLTRIASGSLKLGAAGTLTTTSGLEIAGGNLDLNGFATTVPKLFGTGGSVLGGTTLTVLTSDNQTYSGSINNTMLLMAGTGTQTLAGSVDNSGGAARVESGTLVLAKNSSLTVHAVANLNAVGLMIQGGTLKLAGTGDDQIFDDTIVNQNGGILDLNDTNERFRGLTGTAGTVLNQGVGTSTLTLGETSGSAGTYSYGGVIADGTSGIVQLVKSGTSTQVLTGANTYTGLTDINSGRLVVDGSLAATGIMVYSGALLGGNGSVGGQVDVQTGGGISTTISNWTGTAGTGFSDLSIAGGLSFAGTTQIIQVNTSGLTNFSETNTTFPIVTAAGGISGFVAGDFQVVAPGFVGAGTWSVQVTGNTLELVYTAATGYAGWISGYGYTGTDANFDSDPDHDGIDNGMEYVLGGDPSSPVDLALLPTIELVNQDLGSGPADYLLFTYRRKDAANAFVTIQAQYSTDLSTWTTAVDGVNGVEILIDNDYTFTPASPNTDRVRVYVPRGTNAKIFGRLDATNP